jgi:hypothetical protein
VTTDQHEHRQLCTAPERIKELPTDKHGRPVPWFVLWADGVPDFRVVRARGLQLAWTEARCWVCGQRRGATASFVIGPMCSVNRVSPEPPSHLDCALYSAQFCPFLATPQMIRRDRGLKEEGQLSDGYSSPAGVMIERNPGVALVWTSRNFSAFKAPGGVLFDVGEPQRVSWWAQGRPATREEVEHSLDTGLPSLAAACRSDQERNYLDVLRKAVDPLLPA